MKKLGKYVMTDKIGEGQFGQGLLHLATYIQILFKVFKGINENTNQQVAVKAVSKENLNKIKKLKELFIQEVTIMKRLDNENVIKLIDYVESPSTCYMILEYCNQGDLESLLEKQNYLPEEEALVHFQEILNGFQCLHKNNVIHRDFKAANVMISDGVFKIGDFGFAKESYQTCTILGTPLYMVNQITVTKFMQSPEILQKKPYNNKTDIWSIGVLFYQVLFGTYPFDGNTEKNLLANILKHKLDLKYHGIKISEQTKDLLQKMLIVDPTKRIEWLDLFSHPALNKEQEVHFNLTLQYKQQKLDTTNSIENIWKASQINLNNKHKLKEQSEFYKQKQFVNAQPIDTNNYYGQAIPIQNQPAGSPQHQQEDKADQLQKLLLRYQHEKKIYEQIGNTMKSAFPLLPESEHLVFYFVLSKQYLILSNNLLQSLNQGNNIFKNPFFNIFVQSQQFKELVTQIMHQFNNLHEFFKVFLNQINKLMSNHDFVSKNYAIIKDLKENANINFTQSSFKEFYSQMLRDYYIKINEKALAQEKQNSNNEALKYYRLCYQMLDCILMPSNYPFESKNKEGNIVSFDFFYYNSRTLALSLQQIKQEIEFKFMETLQNI